MVSSRRLAFNALLLASTIGCGGAPTPSAPSSSLNQTVGFSLPSDTGSLVSIPLTEHAVVLDAWAPSCEPCRKKLPALFARRADIEERGAKLVLIAVLSEGESTESARATLNEWGIRAPFLVDRGDVLRREAGVSELPSTLVLDPDGRVRWVAPATATAEDVVAAIN